VRLKVSILLNELVDLDGDVLLLFDCCEALPKAVTSYGRGVIVAITATGFGRLSDGGGIAEDPGPDSFTRALINGLSRLCHENRRFSDEELHTVVTAILENFEPEPLLNEGRQVMGTDGRPYMKPNRRRSPSYRFLSENKQPKPIFMAPLPTFGESRSIDHNQPHQDVRGLWDVLVGIRFETDSPDVDALAELLAEVREAREINLVGAWKSQSTLWIVRLPLTMWTLMPKHRGMSFLARVTGNNMIDDVRKELQGHLVARGLNPDDDDDARSIVYTPSGSDSESGTQSPLAESPRNNRDGESTSRSPRSDLEYMRAVAKLNRNVDTQAWLRDGAVQRQFESFDSGVELTLKVPELGT
jgi:hypothetical protein